MIFALYERPEGVVVADVTCVVYDLGRDVALRGPVRVYGPGIVWALEKANLVTNRHEDQAALAVEVELDPGTEWVVRCDRVDFPPGGVAYRHEHPGPGVRRLLSGSLTIESNEGARVYGPGEAWFEDAGDSVLATASATEETAFVRVMLLPAEWAGRRTIRYLDPADEEKPKLQRVTVFLEEPIEL